MQVRQRLRSKEIIQIASHKKRFYWIQGQIILHVVKFMTTVKN